MIKTPSGYIEKYYRWIWLPAILPAILLAIGCLSYGGQSYSGINLLTILLQNKEQVGLINVLLSGGGMVILSILVVLALVLHLLRKDKLTINVLIACEAMLMFFHCTSIFTMKKSYMATGVFGSDLMVWDFNIFYVASLLASIVALSLVLKASKIDTGYIALVILSVIWLFPVFYIIMNALRAEGGFYVNYLVPKTFSLNNFRKLLSGENFQYVTWFKNTLLVAIASCILSSFIVLSTAYTISRVRFAGRKVIMNLMLVLGMFPSFMSMIAVYYILKGMGIAQSLIALVLVYSGGAALSYYIAKGFFDTIPKALDEAAYLDGASKWTVFTKITMPLSKPIIIYTIMTSFMAPWGDYIFASVILGDKSSNYTIAMGLFKMLTKENVDKYFTQFAAGAVLVSIPIAILFISLQKYYVEGLAGSVKG